MHTLTEIDDMTTKAATKAPTKRAEKMKELAIRPDATIAEHLRSLIRMHNEAGLSQRQIALRAGIPPTLVTKLMAGGTVYVETAEYLAHALGKRLRL